VTERKRYTILARVHRGEEFESADEVAEAEAKMARLVELGIIEVVPVVKHRSSMSIGEEAWFRDKRTGHVYRYVKPDFPSRGHWGPVEDPATPSVFESMCPDVYPTLEQYRALVGKLDAAWAAGEIECGQFELKKRLELELEDVFFYHPPSDESYDLTLANAYQPGGCWMKTFFSKKAGNWPGEFVLGEPPWRRDREPREGKR
jgi:hypothetical protein